MSAVLSQVPLWVWPLLAGLVALGLLSLRERRTHLALVYGLPLLGVLSLRLVAGLEAGLVGWAALALGYGLGGWAGWRHQARATLAKTARHIRQKGEALTGLAVVTLFGVNFAVGTIAAVAPEVLERTGPALGVALVAGLASGSFAGRAALVATRQKDSAA